MCIYTRRLYKSTLCVCPVLKLTWRNRSLGSDHVMKMAGKTKAAERSESWLGSQFKFAQILTRILVLFWVYLDLFSRFLPRQLEDDNGCFGRTATYFWTFAQRLCWIIANNYGWTINDYKAIYFILSVCLQLPVAICTICFNTSRVTPDYWCVGCTTSSLGDSDTGWSKGDSCKFATWTRSF